MRSSYDIKIMGYKICVYAICKNEIAFVDRWIKNVSEADYVVVLDTGSTDGTYERLKADPRITKVVQKEIKPWRFDVARNESMKLIPKDADICVCTDFDELFNEGWAEVLRVGWRPDSNRGLYTFAWQLNELGEPQDVFKYDKIHDNKNYKWIFPIHEILSVKDPEMLQNVVDFGETIYLKHYQDKSKPRKYYLDLLKVACDENPTSPHVRMLYAREFLVQDSTSKENVENAKREYLYTLGMPRITEPDFKTVRIFTLVQLALIYFNEPDYDKALSYCVQAMQLDYTMRDPYLILAETYNMLGLPALAEGVVAAAEEYTYRHYSWAERTNTFLGWLPETKANVKARLGKYDEALTAIDEALSHAPSDQRLLQVKKEYADAYVQQLKSKAGSVE